jgi:hypothetical protein
MKSTHAIGGLREIPVGHQKVRIARDADFLEFLDGGSAVEKTLAAQALRGFLKNAAGVRTPAVDLARQRLAELRQSMH